ncbi:hypothetical protein [Chamaesiphon minutus]|nr:hypothetical protein [Chamaesiphon minutus]
MSCRTLSVGFPDRGAPLLRMCFSQDRGSANDFGGDRQLMVN